MRNTNIVEGRGGGEVRKEEEGGLFENVTQQLPFLCIMRDIRWGKYYIFSHIVENWGSKMVEGEGR